MRTIHVALPTPFAADGRLLPGQLERHVGGLVAKGVAAFLPAAGTGEFHSLTAAEVADCVRAARQGAGDSAAIIAPVGFALEETIERARSVIRAGADGLLLMPPIHPYVSDRGLETFLEALHAAVNVPIMIYKKAAVPSNELLARLISRGVLTGVKYAINDLSVVSSFIDGLGGRAAVHCGTGERYAPFFMMAGACGFSSGIINICPRLCLGMLQALRSGDVAPALKVMRIVRPLEDLRARDGDALSVGVLKTVLARQGLAFGRARPPLRDPTPEEEREIVAAAEPVVAAEQSAQPLIAA